MKYRLKAEYINAIKTNPLLYGQVANVLGISIASVTYNLYNGKPERFTQKGVLKVISDYLNVPESELTESVEETENA